MLKVHRITEIPLDCGEHLQVICYEDGSREFTHMTKEPLVLQKFKVGSQNFFDIYKALGDA
jgi:hypothetical protein